jgi:hypothetical protein
VYLSTRKLPGKIHEAIGRARLPAAQAHRQRNGIKEEKKAARGKETAR